MHSRPLLRPQQVRTCVILNLIAGTTPLHLSTQVPALPHNLANSLINHTDMASPSPHDKEGCIDLGPAFTIWLVYTSLQSLTLTLTVASTTWDVSRNEYTIRS